jgi:hypothetical protein
VSGEKAELLAAGLAGSPATGSPPVAVPDPAEVRPAVKDDGGELVCQGR